MPHTIFMLSSVLWCNRQTIAHLILRHKPKNRRGDFVGQTGKPERVVLRPNIRNVATGFEAKLGQIVNLGFEEHIDFLIQ
jgi:hypothetical protein